MWFLIPVHRIESKRDRTEHGNPAMKPRDTELVVVLHQGVTSNGNSASTETGGLASTGILP